MGLVLHCKGASCSDILIQTSCNTTCCERRAHACISIPDAQSHPMFVCLSKAMECEAWLIDCDDQIVHPHSRTKLPATWMQKHPGFLVCIPDHAANLTFFCFLPMLSSAAPAAPGAFPLELPPCHRQSRHSQLLKQHLTAVVCWLPRQRSMLSRIHQILRRGHSVWHDLCVITHCTGDDTQSACCKYFIACVTTTWASFRIYESIFLHFEISGNMQDQTQARGLLWVHM